MSDTPNKNKGHLRDTFIVLFICISCTPLLLVGGLSLVNLSSSHRQNVSQLEHQTLIRVSEETSAFFTDIIETLSTNFDTLDSSTLSTSVSSWQELYAKKFLDDNKAILEVSFINQQGKETAKSSRINPNPRLLYVSELPAFQKALKNETTISSIHTSPYGQTVTITAPSVLNGKVFNVVMAEVSISSLASNLQKIHVGKTGYVVLFDREGTMLGERTMHDTYGFINFSKWSKVIDTIAGNVSDGLSKNDRYVSPLTNISVVSSSILVKNINWPLIVEWPLGESDALIESFRNKILGSLLLCFILVIGLAPYLASRLVRPIRKLQEVADEIQKGKFDNSVSIKTNDELEELGESFNTMALGLKRLEELKSEFVYIAAHELRSPVTAIKGYMELIFDGNGGRLTPELTRLLSPVKNSNDRLVNLVNDLLKVARSEAGRLEVSVVPTDIRNEVRAILDEVKPLAQKRNMTVVYEPPLELPLALVDPGSFKEIIMNFVSNSIKYGNDNGTVSVVHTVTDTMVTTAIADNGRGISLEDQRHLFEKFFRTGDVKKSNIEGTGLGLFITKELIEKMGGILGVTSTVGVGTTFSVSFKKSA